MLFWYSKSYFDIRTESKYRISIFKFQSWHSNWVRKCYFDIQNPILHSNWVGKCYFDIQNPILTSELSQKMLFWYSKSYFDIRTESEKSILTCSFDIQNLILTFEPSRKIVFWPSKSYFDIRTESENRNLTFEILFWHSNWVGK